MSINPDVKYTAKYIMSPIDGGYCFKYFCAMCGYHYATGRISADTEAEAREQAEREARKHFNGCHRCGRWVCDEHYNMAEMMCVECVLKGGIL